MIKDNILDVKKVLTNWDIGDIITFKKAEKGVSNHNWVIKTTKGKYILRKVRQDRKLSELKFELKYLDYLKEKKFPYFIPSPIKNRGGDVFIRQLGSYFWIYEFIEGVNIKRFNRLELKECARMMATYHEIVVNSGLNNKKGGGDVFNKVPVLRELKGFLFKISKKSNTDKKERVFSKEVLILIRLLRNLDGGEYSKMKKYPLHRDLNPENTLWKNGKLVGIIDFENVGSQNDTIIKDISGMLQYSCRDKKYNYKLDLKLANFFFKEYRKYRPLSEKEISYIPNIITAGAIEDFSYSYWMLINDSERAKPYRLKLYSKVAQWSNQNKNQIIEAIKW